MCPQYVVRNHRRAATVGQRAGSARRERGVSAKRESDLYAPVRDFLVAQGFTVQAEVHGCDVTARRGNDLVIVELKRNLSLNLLAQAAQRQTITDSVYMAVPRPAGSLRRGPWRRTVGLVRRLCLGLLLVGDGDPAIEVVCHPLPYRPRRDKRRRRAILSEIRGRSGDYNLGGTGGKPVMTAYREQALHIARRLAGNGPCSPSKLRCLGCSYKTQSILYDNHYGWFDRVARGLYALSPAGRQALVEHADVPDPAEPEAALDDPAT